MSQNKIISEDIKNIIDSDTKWSNFKNKTILVSGANGFIPAYIVETLLNLNKSISEMSITVLAIVRNFENAKVRFKYYLNDKNLKLIVQDISTKIDYDGEVNYIIHAASQASPKYYTLDPVGTLMSNVMGTINLLEFARMKDIKSFLFFSSAEVYGDLSNEHQPIKENTFGYIDPLNVKSCYPESKRMGENICVSYFNQYSIPVKIVRPFHTYGPGMKLNDGRVFADFVNDILNNNNIVLLSSGESKRSFCYLSDATIAFFKVLLNGQNGQAYNVGNQKETYSIFELAQRIVNLYPEKNLEVVRKNKLEINIKNEFISEYTPCLEKLMSLNWEPSISVEQGFKRTIESYYD